MKFGALFDMDGLLIESEPLWLEAELKVFNQIGMPITLDMLKETAGLRVSEIVEYWIDRYQPTDYNAREIVATLEHEVVSLIKDRGKLKLGVCQILSSLKENGFSMAIASTSPNKIIKSVVNMYQLDEYFDSWVSADECEKGKPHPEVYKTAAERLGVDLKRCLAFDDSLIGLKSAKAAGALVVAVTEEDFSIEEEIPWDIKLNTLLDFEKQHIDQLHTR